MLNNKIEDADVFQDTYCESCSLCLSSASYPLFCFHTVYQENPGGFAKYVYPQLCELTEFEIDSRSSTKTFKQLFCSPVACKEQNLAYENGECPNFEHCYRVFLEQITSSDPELEELALELEESNGEFANIHNLKDDYGDFNDGNTNVNLPAKVRVFPSSDEFDYDDDNQFYYMTHGMSKSQYLKEKYKTVKEAKVSVFTSKNAAWTATLKKIFNKK